MLLFSRKIRLQEAVKSDSTVNVGLGVSGDGSGTGATLEFCATLLEAQCIPIPHLIPPSKFGLRLQREQGHQFGSCGATGS